MVRAGPQFPTSEANLSININPQADRVTTEDVEREIGREFYFTGQDGVAAGVNVGTSAPGVVPADLRLMTFCILILRNGTKLVGVNHGPVAAENFDAAVGRRMARQDAVRQIWPLLGWSLRERQARAADVAVAGAS